MLADALVKILQSLRVSLSSTCVATSGAGLAVHAGHSAVLGYQYIADNKNRITDPALYISYSYQTSRREYGIRQDSLNAYA